MCSRERTGLSGGTFGSAVAEHLWFRSNGRSERILVLDNFTLRLEFCLPHPRGNSNDNSGVFVRFRNFQILVLPGRPGPDVPGNPATVAVDTGYEIQIDEEARGDTRKGEPDGFSSTARAQSTR